MIFHCRGTAVVGMLFVSDVNVTHEVAAGRKRLRVIVPLLECLTTNDRNRLGGDIVAGVTLAAYAVPVSLAYASLAGLPPQVGAYCYLVGGLAYALLGTSRQLAIGPTSAIAILVGTVVPVLAEGDAARIPGIAALTALAAAGLGVLAWLLRLSGLVNFIGETILTGFKAGAALTIGLTQLPKLFGVPGGGDHFFERTAILIGQLPQTNLTVLAIGLAALTLLVLGDRFLPGRPIALGVVVLFTGLVSWLGLSERGVATVGVLPAGLPHLAWPSLHLRDVDGVLPLAAACFLLSYVESVAAARSLAAKHDYAISPRQELLALAAANAAAAFSQGFPVAGGLSQSAVNDKAGARTPLALVFASATIAVCLVFLTQLLRNLPSVVLAAIVLVAVRSLIDVAALRHLWRVSRREFTVAAVALVGVLLLGILKGVLLAVVVSLLMLLSTAAAPHVAVLGRIPGTNRFSDAERHQGNQSIPGVLIFRVEAAVLYFNAEHIRSAMWARIAAAEELQLVILDLSNAPHVDVAGAEMLTALHHSLEARGARLRVVEARSHVRELLRAVEFERKVGYVDRHSTLTQAIAEFESR